MNVNRVVGRYVQSFIAMVMLLGQYPNANVLNT